MDFPDEDGDGPCRSRLLAHEVGAEAIVLLHAAFDKFAERRQTAEFRRIGSRLRSPRSVRHQAGCQNESAEDHSTLRFSLRISVDHLVSSLSTSAVYSSALEVSGSPPSK